MASFGLLGAEPAPPDDRTKGRFQRGKDAENYHARRLIERFGPDNVIREKAIPWPNTGLPVGELHQDFFIPSERMVNEVKSSESDALYDAYATQTAGEVYWDDDAEYGALTFLDRDYQETAVYPILITDTTAELLESIASQVVECGKTGTLPPRVCQKPADGISLFCPFIEQCFDGWVAPEVVDGDPALASLFSEAWLAKQAAKAAAAEQAAANERWEDAKARLADAGLEPGETLCGGIRVKRIDVRDSEKLDLSKARKAGVWNALQDELFGPFLKLSGGHTRFDVERVDSEQPLDLDFGDEAPF